MLAKIESRELPLQVYGVEVLGLATQTVNKLRMAQINTLQGLINCAEGEMLYIPRVGIATLENIKSKLKAWLSMTLSRND